jgi:hypothetical protein
MGIFSQIVVQQASVLITSVGILFLTFGFVTIFKSKQETVGTTLVSIGGSFFITGSIIFLIYRKKLMRIREDNISLV